MTAGRLLVAAALVFTTGACGGDDDEGGEQNTNPDQPFGETAIVVVANPVVNGANTTPVPSVLDPDRRDGIAVDAEPGGDTTTDASGLGVIDEGLAQGDLGLTFAGGPTLPFSIVSDGDVYDLAVAFDGNAVEASDNFPIRYAVGGQIQEFDETSDPAAIADALANNGNIVFFKNGTYTGNLLITGDDVIFFGEGFTERQVTIDGSVDVKGTGVRIRGFDISGDVTVAGNSFGMAFTIVRGSTSITGNAAAFLRNSFCGSVNVPSSNASLLDNDGLDPLPQKPEVCAPPSQ